MYVCEFLLDILSVTDLFVSRTAQCRGVRTFDSTLYIPCLEKPVISSDNHDSESGFCERLGAFLGTHSQLCMNALQRLTVWEEAFGSIA